MTHLERFIVSLELLVYYAEPEINLIGLFEVCAIGVRRRSSNGNRAPITLIHSENTGERLFGVLERAIAVIENADAVPQLGILLWAMEVEECILISIVCVLKLILHEKAMTERTPYVTILVVDLDSAIKVFNCLPIEKHGETCVNSGRRRRGRRSEGSRDGHMPG